MNSFQLLVLICIGFFYVYKQIEVAVVMTKDTELTKN